MKSLINFINDFRSRSGFSVFGSSIINKISGFILSIFIVRFLTKEDFGYVSFTLSIMSVLLSIAGFGGNWSLLRYGSITNSMSEKRSLFFSFLKLGTFFNVILFTFIYLSFFFLPEKFIPAKKYLSLVGLGIFTHYSFELLKSYFRVLNKNYIFAKLNIQSSFVLLLLVFIFAFFLQGYGYVLATVLAPLVCFLFYFFRIYNRSYIIDTNFRNEFISYGIYTGVGAIASQITITASPVIAGFLGVNPEQIALLKTATIIPFNLLIIPLIIMTTDFVHISKLHQNPQYLKDYYLNYLKTIFSLSILPFSLMIIFHKDILTLLFGNSYIESSEMFLILLISVFFSFMFRVPLGNILGSIGKANWNVVHSTIWFFLFIPLCYFLNLSFGIQGFAIAIATVIILSGFISLLLFFIFLRNMPPSPAIDS